MKKRKSIEKNIELALDSIRPYLNSDGGDIELVEITKDMVVKVRLLGSCESCHVNLMTLENTVEMAIRGVFPGLKRVVSV